MSALSRRKGKTGELEVVHEARGAGFADAKRTSDGRRQVDGDIAGIPGTYVEVRRRETLSMWRWLDEVDEAAGPTRLPVLAFRRNGNTRWYAALPLDELLALLHHRDTA